MISINLISFFFSYGVPSFTDLEKNSNFYVVENIFVDIDAGELNDI
jgi:hypothetical protein